MMRYLLDCGFLPEEIKEFELNTTPVLLNEMIDKKDLVTKNIIYLINLGISNYKIVFINYYEFFLLNNEKFISIFDKYDKNELIKYIESDFNIVQYL